MGDKHPQLVSSYFPACLFCGETSIKSSFWGDKHTAKCNSCGAEWHLYINQLTDEFKWAILRKAGNQGGAELLGRQGLPEFWKQMSLARLGKKIKPTQSEGEEKVIIHETRKEVIIMTRVRIVRQGPLRLLTPRSVHQESMMRSGIRRKWRLFRVSRISL